jgi:hypothetical protein
MVRQFVLVGMGYVLVRRDEVVGEKRCRVEGTTSCTESVSRNQGEIERYRGVWFVRQGGHEGFPTVVVGTLPMRIDVLRLFHYDRLGQHAGYLGLRVDDNVTQSRQVHPILRLAQVGFDAFRENVTGVGAGFPQ